MRVKHQHLQKCVVCSTEQPLQHSTRTPQALTQPPQIQHSVRGKPPAPCTASNLTSDRAPPDLRQKLNPTPSHHPTIATGGWFRRCASPPGEACSARCCGSWPPPHPLRQPVQCQCHGPSRGPFRLPDSASRYEEMCFVKEHACTQHACRLFTLIVLAGQSPSMTAN